MKRIQSDSASSNHDEGGVKRVLDRWLAQGMQGTLGVTTKREKKWEEDEIIDRGWLWFRLHGRVGCFELLVHTEKQRWRVLCILLVS